MSGHHDIAGLVIADAHRIIAGMRTAGSHGLTITRWRVNANTLSEVRCLFDPNGVYLVTLRTVDDGNGMMTTAHELYGIPLDIAQDLEDGRIVADVQVGA